MTDLDLSSYGLTGGPSGSLSFDVDGAIATRTPKFVSALEQAAGDVSAASASVIAGLDAAAEVATYVSTDVAAALTAASADATAIGASTLTGPLAPVVAALIVAIAVVEGNLASGGTGCCGAAPYSREQAIAQLTFEQDPLGLGGGSSFYAPSEDAIRNLRLYSGQGSDAPPCPADHYSWDVSFGAKAASGTNDTATRVLIARPAGSPEAFIEGVMRAAWEQQNGCWTDVPKLQAALPAILAAAVKAWNNTHLATSSRTILVTPIDPWANPITVAAQELARSAGQDSATISINVNTGAAVHPLAAGLLAKIAHVVPSTGKVRPTMTPSLVANLVPRISPTAFAATPAQATAARNIVAISGSSSSGLMSIFSKKIVGSVTLGEVGLVGVALVVVGKVMGVR